LPGALAAPEGAAAPAAAAGPDEVAAGFGAALRSGDVELAGTLLARQACVVTPDSTVIEGRPAVADFLRQFVQMTGELTIDQRSMLTAGEVALGRESWSLVVGGGTNAVRRTTRATIVLSRIEGAWKIAVVDPWRGVAPTGRR
jgi:ketosteroid isomerase-like protein